MTANCHICRCLLLVTSLVGCSLGLNSTAEAQRHTHQLYHSDAPPGALGAMQIGARRAQAGYVQPVQIKVPVGAIVSVADQGGFQYDSPDLRVGLTVGQPYRFRVTGIPQHETQSLYPSIELIDHLHPPAGQRDRFPIPIEITADDLQIALSGTLVVRVIYVEDPARAFPEAATGEQLSTEVLASEDPLHVADEMGRPVAIMRLGSRIPTDEQIDSDFVFGAPPVEILASPPLPELNMEPWEQEPAPLMMKTPLSQQRRRGPERAAPSVPSTPEQVRPKNRRPEAPAAQQPTDIDGMDSDGGTTPDRTDSIESETPIESADEAPGSIDPFEVGESPEPGNDPFLDDDVR